MSAKSFPTDLVASVAVGVAITNTVKLSGIHGLVEHVLGHPVWSHEVGTQLPFASAKLKPLFADLAPPDMDDMRRMSPEARRDATMQFHQRVVARHGTDIEVEKGDGVRAADPMTTARALYPKTEIVGVKVP